MPDQKDIWTRITEKAGEAYRALRRLLSSAPSGEPSGMGAAAKPRRSTAETWIALAGSLLLAFFIWLFVMSTDSPGYEGEFKEVPIHIENLSTLSILSEDNLTVDLRVEGKRSIINDTSLADIDVSVTVAEGTLPGRYSYELEIQLPGGLRLVESSLSNVMLYLDNTTSVSVPIRVKLSDYILPDSYEIAEAEKITTSIQSVVVTGPESLLRTVDCAQVALSLGTVTRSVTCIGSLSLVDMSGDPISSSYVRMAQSEVTVTIPVYKYRTIEPTILFEYGYFNEENVRVTCSPADITIKGEADAVDRIEWVRTINEKTVSGDSTMSFGVDFGDSVTVVGDVKTVSVTIEHIGTVTRNMILSGFRILNDNGHGYELVDKYLSVTLRGDAALLMNMTSAMIRAEVDLGKYNLSSGIVSAPVTLTILGTYAGQVWEIGSYTLAIRFTS